MSKNSTGKKRRNILSPAELAVADAVLIGVGLLVFALFHHALPQKYMPEEPVPAVVSASEPVEPEPAPVSPTDEDYGIEPPFTKGVVMTEDSYSSPDVAITLSSGVVECNEDERAVYHVEDIYLKDITKLRSAFGQNQYGKGILEEIPAMASAHSAICAINGDFYGVGSRGMVVRNGKVYRPNDDTDDEILLLLADGTMEISTHNTRYKHNLIEEKDIWQAWSFGPSLLTEEGKSKRGFQSVIKQDNPRTVIGYYEPGHYCFITVDGRSENSHGMSLNELSLLCESLGCKIAYNLDGGQSSMMMFGGSIVNEPYRGGRKVSDIIYISEREEQAVEEQ